MSCFLRKKHISCFILFIAELLTEGKKLISSEDRNWLFENVAIMNEPPLKTSGMDIIIICSNTSASAEFWQKRLSKTRAYFLHPEAIIISVEETWAEGGAGNGLGTLYAYKNAREKAQAELGIDIVEYQRQGITLVFGAAVLSDAL